ncbi:dTDP-4-dehydrorhamnose reductase [Cochleicola gelatinilyticus]|uniref:dTDP-4-dehydrorhamnose reductase n=1 Tax=Cochleicola gelatinilyticus TaxID=1763537 RepID=A0A167J1B5_9FLAO|nr:dTDP-4-dehydrorhamnose reductase [Cochleicola gelatinilyticus]OAB80228.1 NAD(P)-dependent oxidoreductase [Cochleicola gelatinilyticus]
MKQVLVTGANGQLGRCIALASKQFPKVTFHFLDRQQLDITNNGEILEVFKKNTFDYCINAAAYTNVEQAEKEEELAFGVNAEGVKYLSQACQTFGVVLLHISTDYVFDGKKSEPYNELDATNPINVYGTSKLAGELAVIENCERYFIFRTSWLYSQFGHNFLNTIIKKASEGASLTITTEQTGTPTNANDLAEMLLHIITSESEAYGLYHFSNKGKATWYDFAEAILEFTQQIDTVKLAKTDHYRTFAARPKNSVLELIKFKTKFNIEMFNWKVSLKDTVKYIKNH